MTELDILLVNPISRDIPPAYPPHGLLSIAAVLMDNGYKVRIHDRNADKTDFATILKKYNPTVVGLSCLTGPVINDAVNISQVTRQKQQHTPIIWGGLHPTLFPEQVLREEFVDFIVLGEGERTILDLMQNIAHPEKYQNIKGIAYKEGGRVRTTPPREVIRDLDELPLGAWDLLDIKKYCQSYFYGNRVLVLHTSRGCPFRCAYCVNPILQRRTWRGRSASRIIEEINLLKYKYKIDGVHFFDDLFDSNKKRLDEFCRKATIEKLDIPWHHSSRVNYATKERLMLEKEAGCVLIEYGVESGSQKMLNFMRKDQTIPQTIQAFRNCNEVGIRANALFMIGLPTETIDEVKATLNLIKALPFYQAVCSIYKPYPGSELFNFCIQTGRLKLPDRLKEIGTLYSFSEEHFNMSEVPPNYLEGIQDFIMKRNTINLIKGCVMDRNFGLLLHQTINHLEPKMFKIFARALR